MIVLKVFGPTWPHWRSLPVCKWTLYTAGQHAHSRFGTLRPRPSQARFIKPAKSHNEAEHSAEMVSPTNLYAFCVWFSSHL